MKLNGGVDDLLRLIGGEKLGHRSLAGDARRAGVFQPRGAVDEKRGGVDVERHVGDMPLHHLKLGQRRALHAPSGHAVQRLVQRAAGEPQRGGGDRSAEHVEHRHGDAEPLAGATDHRCRRDPAVCEPERGERMGRDGFQPFGHLESRQVRGDDETRQPLGPRCLTRADKERVDIRDPAVGDPRLFAVQDIVVAVAGRGHRGIRHVRPRPRLGQRKGGNRRAAPGLGQPRLLLGVVPEQRDRPSAQSLHREREIREAIVAGERFADQGEASHVEVACLAGGMLQKARVTQGPHQRTAGGVGVRVVNLTQIGRRPILQPCGEVAVARLEERPVEITRVGHQSPSNTGVLPAMNAS